MPLDRRILGEFRNYSPVIPARPKPGNFPISESAQGGLAFKCIGAIGAVVARFVHTEEVTGSNPVSPTETRSVSAPLSGNGPFLCLVTVPAILSAPCERVFV